MKKINKKIGIALLFTTLVVPKGSFVAMESKDSMGPRSHPTNTVLLTKAFKKTIEALQQKIQSGKTFSTKNLYNETLALTRNTENKLVGLRRKYQKSNKILFKQTTESQQKIKGLKKIFVEKLHVEINKIRGIQQKFKGLREIFSGVFNSYFNYLTALQEIVQKIPGLEKSRMTHPKPACHRISDESQEQNNTQELHEELNNLEIFVENFAQEPSVHSQEDLDVLEQHSTLDPINEDNTRDEINEDNNQKDYLENSIDLSKDFLELSHNTNIEEIEPKETIPPLQNFFEQEKKPEAAVDLENTDHETSENIAFDFLQLPRLPHQVVFTHQKDNPFDPLSKSPSFNQDLSSDQESSSSTSLHEENLSELSMSCADQSPVHQPTVGPKKEVMNFPKTGPITINLGAQDTIYPSDEDMGLFKQRPKKISAKKSGFNLKKLLKKTLIAGVMGGIYWIARLSRSGNNLAFDHLPNISNPTSCHQTFHGNTFCDPSYYCYFQNALETERQPWIEENLTNNTVTHSFQEKNFAYNDPIQSSNNENFHKKPSHVTKKDTIEEILGKIHHCLENIKTSNLCHKDFRALKTQKELDEIDELFHIVEEIMKKTITLLKRNAKEWDKKEAQSILSSLGYESPTQGLNAQHLSQYVETYHARHYETLNHLKHYPKNFGHEALKTFMTEKIDPFLQEQQSPISFFGINLSPYFHPRFNNKEIGNIFEISKNIKQNIQDQLNFQHFQKNILELYSFELSYLEVRNEYREKFQMYSKQHDEFLEKRKRMIEKKEQDSKEKLKTLSKKESQIIKETMIEDIDKTLEKELLSLNKKNQELNNLAKTIRAKNKELLAKTIRAQNKALKNMAKKIITDPGFFLENNRYTVMNLRNHEFFSII
jgi:hypothetical protein